MTHPLQAAEALYRGEGLAFPSVPAPIAGDLRQLDGNGFATRQLAWTLYDFNRFLDELVSGDPAPYCAFGFAGHGVASQAAHLYSVDDRVAFLLQLRWGAVFGDPETDRERYDALLEVERLIRQSADDAVRAGRFPRGERLVVAQSTFHGSRWSWVAKGGKHGAPKWRSSRDLAPIEAFAELHRLAVA
jgi:hypothetical protein